MIIVNGITKRSILDVAAVLDPPLTCHHGVGPEWLISLMQLTKSIRYENRVLGVKVLLHCSCKNWSLWVLMSPYPNYDIARIKFKHSYKVSGVKSSSSSNCRSLRKLDLCYEIYSCGYVVVRLFLSVLAFPILLFFHRNMNERPKAVRFWLQGVVPVCHTMMSANAVPDKRDRFFTAIDLNCLKELTNIQPIYLANKSRSVDKSNILVSQV